jgi:hypothetical protein
MARYVTTEISGTQCIGDSRVVINTNFENLDTKIQTLSTNTLTLSTTSTVQFVEPFNSATRRIAAFVRPASINSTHLASDAVITTNLSAQAVTTDKIALSAVTANRINLVTSLSTNGYQIMPNGLIMQWGKIDNIDFNQTNQGPYTFPVAFPNNCLNIVTTIIYDTAINGVWNANVNTVTLSSFRVYGDYDSGTGTAPIYWQAIGY